MDISDIVLPLSSSELGYQYGQKKAPVSEAEERFTVWTDSKAKVRYVWSFPPSKRPDRPEKSLLSLLNSTLIY